MIDVRTPATVKSYLAFLAATTLCLAACQSALPRGTARPPIAAAVPLDPEQEEYVQDVMAFTGSGRDDVLARIGRRWEPLKEEWEAWEKQGPMTPDRVTRFYKETRSYIYELGEWHLFSQEKRKSDRALIEQIRALRPANILDFGGGAGLNAIPLARAGFDVTLADLDGASLNFAAFRAARHGTNLKIWKSDVDDLPPDRTYHVILALDVLEHLPKEVLKSTVDKLVRLKTPKTQVIFSAPFGRTSEHPMHLDQDEETKAQVRRLWEKTRPR